MRVNYKKLIIWLLVLIIWAGSFIFFDYVVGQHYGKNVATKQFDEHTTAYKELKTQKTFERTLNLIGIAGGIFCLVMAARSVKIPKENKEE